MRDHGHPHSLALGVPDRLDIRSVITLLGLYDHCPPKSLKTNVCCGWDLWQSGVTIR